MKAAEVLALVDDQFGEIRKQFNLQLRRTAQLQLQLDKIQKNTPLIIALVKKESSGPPYVWS